MSLPPPTVGTTSDPPAGGTTIPGAVQVGVDDDLAALVSSAPAGTTFMLDSGVHRSDLVVPKDGMSFIGRDGAVVSGAAVLGEFAKTGDLWELDGIDLAPDSGGECVAGYSACGLPNDLFIDGVMLWRVDDEDEVEPGRWWGGDGRVVIADDPTNRVVELSMVSHAFVGSADGVTIRNLVVEKFAVPSQDAAIQAQELDDGARGEGWLIENVETRFNHAAGLRTGDATRVLGVFAHHNGQLGIAVSGGRDVLIADSELSHNNTRGYFWEWEGGGGKFTRTEGLVVRDSYSHDNLGPGLWTDIDCVDTLYEGNTVADNLGPGIFHEISGVAVIRDNVVTGNGLGKRSWAWGAGILIAASFDVEIVGNEVTGNADGITGVQQERGDGPLGPRLLARVAVRDNEIGLASGITGVVQDVGDDAVFADERDISFSGNTYIDVGRRRAFAWDDRYLTFSEWKGVGQDVDGATE